MVSFGTLRVEALDKSRSSWLPDARMETGSDKIRIAKLVRSRRRTIELTITEDARLVVRAPLRTPLHLIHGVIDKKQQWIRRKIREAGSRRMLPPREFRDGERFMFLGKTYKLEISRHMERPVELGDRLYISSLALPEARRALKEWFRENAARHISGRCAHYARLIGRAPNLVRISNAEKRWGSCSPEGNLNFSWRLMMAPPGGDRLHRRPRDGPHGGPEPLGLFLGQGGFHNAGLSRSEKMAQGKRLHADDRLRI